MRFSCTLFVALLSLPNLAQAQHRDAQRPRRAADAPEAALDARGYFMRGVSRYEEGALDAALADFERSYELAPVAGVLTNIAVTLTDLNRLPEAIDIYRRWLDTAAHATSERRALVSDAIRALEARVATLSLNVATPDAEVRIDGRSVGRVPLSAPIRVTGGSHVIEILAEGYVSVREELILAGGESRTVELNLAPIDRSATLRLTSSLEEAQLRIDGLDVGHGSAERRLPAGGHIVEGLLTSYRTYRTQITLSEHQELDLRIVLESAQLGVDSEPWFWVVIGLAAVGVVGAITAGSVCGATDLCIQYEVTPGNVSPGVIRL